MYLSHAHTMQCSRKRGSNMKYKEYIKPELLIIIPVLYVIGLIIKNTEKIKDKYIPAILGLIGVVLSAVYIIAVEGFSLASIFTAITQGILITGVAVYTNQLIKQAKE